MNSIISQVLKEEDAQSDRSISTKGKILYLFHKDIIQLTTDEICFSVLSGWEEKLALFLLTEHPDPQAAVPVSVRTLPPPSSPEVQPSSSPVYNYLENSNCKCEQGMWIQELDWNDILCDRYRTISQPWHS